MADLALPAMPTILNPSTSVAAANATGPSASAAANSDDQDDGFRNALSSALDKAPEGEKTAPARKGKVKGEDKATDEDSTTSPGDNSASAGMFGLPGLTTTPVVPVTTPASNGEAGDGGMISTNSSDILAELLAARGGKQQEENNKEMADIPSNPTANSSINPAELNSEVEGVNKLGGLAGLASLVGQGGLVGNGAGEGKDSFETLLAAQTAGESTPDLANLQANATDPSLTAGIVAGSFTTAPTDRGGEVTLPHAPLALDDSQWTGGVSQRVEWMVQNQVQKAEIQVTPPDLGPVKVQVELKGDQATVSFTSPHAAVREALEGALPRLREMFDAQGLNLTDAGVYQQSSFDRSGQGANQQGQNGNRPSFWSFGGEGSDSGVSEPLLTTRRGRGMVDYYA